MLALGNACRTCGDVNPALKTIHSLVFQAKIFQATSAASRMCFVFYKTHLHISYHLNYAGRRKDLVHKLPGVLRRFQYLQRNPLQQKASSTRTLTEHGSCQTPRPGWPWAAGGSRCCSLGGGGTPAQGAWSCVMNWTLLSRPCQGTVYLSKLQTHFITSPARARGRRISLNSDHIITTWQL